MLPRGNTKGAYEQVLAGLVVMCVVVVTSPIVNGQTGDASTRPLLLESLRVGGVGELPQSDLPLDAILRARFTRAVDPASVTADSFRVVGGPAFDVPVEGTTVVVGREIRFVPKLPVLPDLSDAGFAIGGAYRVVIAGDDGASAIDTTRPLIRARGGRALVGSTTADFDMRDVEPYFMGTAMGAPRVVGVAIDLDGDGLAIGDGDARTPEPEEFLADTFPPDLPFVSDVPLGSFSLGPPNAPFAVALLFSEPLDPRVVFAMEGTVTLADATNPYDCDPGPGVTMCPRPVATVLTLRNDYDASLDRFVTRVLLTAETPLRAEALHVVTGTADLADLGGDPLSTDFVAAFLTRTATGIPEDFLVETFDDRSQRGNATTALWSSMPGYPYLRAGLGWGGDGSDGSIVIGDGHVFDTTGNDGIWNFSDLRFEENLASLRVSVVGDKPAVIRTLGNFEIIQNTVLDATGQGGLAGDSALAGALAGGKGGPGGSDGGGSDPTGMERAQDGGAPVEGGGGEGGASGPGPGGGGGGAHAQDGVDGGIGSDGSQSRGRGGDSYGAPGEPYGGAGGGGGGSWTDGGSQVVAGGTGGGGGGLLVIDAGGAFGVRPGQNDVLLDGGNGGSGASDASSAGGGGGAGGYLLVRMWKSAGIIGRDITATGGRRGTAPMGAVGGAGSNGRIAFESVFGNSTSCGACNPAPSFSAIDESMRGRTQGISIFYDTNLGSDVRYAFDASDPMTGEIFPGSNIFDVVAIAPSGEIIEAFPEGFAAFILWSGAQEDPEQPGLPDPATITEWTPDITSLDGLPLIRYGVRFRLPREVFDEPSRPDLDTILPGIDDLRIRISR